MPLFTVPFISIRSTKLEEVAVDTLPTLVLARYNTSYSRSAPLNKPLHGKFDFRCDKCHLLSNIAWSVR